MTREDAINELKILREDYWDDDGYGHETKQYDDTLLALDMAIKALEQETDTWSLEDAREDFMHDVFNTLDFLPTNDEANQIIDSFDRVTSDITQQPCEDCISREDTKQFLYERLDRLNDDELYDIFSRIIDDMYNELPPVTPQPKTGHWIVAKGDSYLGMRNACCSNCKDFYTNDWGYMNYCPNCGARMTESEDKE